MPIVGQQEDAKIIDVGGKGRFIASSTYIIAVIKKTSLSA
jgi:hypothetical protein